MSAASYKMTEMIPSTSAHLIDGSEYAIFELKSLSYKKVNIVACEQQTHFRSSTLSLPTTGNASAAHGFC